MLETNFHFLRPLWLLALMPLGGLFLWLARYRATGNPWSRIVDQHLLSHLLTRFPGPASRFPLWLLGFGWLLAVLALAGPTWKQLPQPVFRLGDAQVLVLDLSRSMDATDVNPSRLTRARFKLLDLLKQRREGQTALLVYAGEPHVVAPLTDDSATIAALIPALSTDLVPLQGSRPDRALQAANQLLERAGVSNGSILLITDGLDNPAAALESVRQLREQGRRLSVLAVGTQEGAPIPLDQGGFLKNANGAVVIPRLDSGPLRRLAQRGGGIYQELTSDDRDLHAIEQVVRTPQTAAKRNDRAQTTEQWREEGPWLALLLLPLGALAFRRGWLGMLLLPPLLLSPPAQAVSWEDLWLRPDQQGQRALEEGRAEEAIEHFADPSWRAAALYRNERYEQAARTLAGLDTAQARYNQGNALARLGRYQEAIEAYDEALEKNPKLEDARFNKELVEKLLEQQNSTPSTPPQEDNSQSSKSPADQKPGESSQANAADSRRPNTDRRQGAEDPQGPVPESSSALQPDQSSPGSTGDPEEQRLPGETQSRNQQPNPSRTPSSGEPSPKAKDDQGLTNPLNEPNQPMPQKESPPQRQGEKTSPSPPLPHAQQGKSATSSSREEQESRQALNQWLRRIPDDPGGLLREKFRREHLRHQQRREEVTQPW